MPADVETMFSGRGQTPWHALGTVVPGEVPAHEAIKLAGLDWTVSVRPCYFKTADGKWAEAPNAFAVVRDSDEKVLGRVGSKFVPLQNQRAFEVFDDLVDDGSFLFDTAGSLKGGSQVWMAGRLPESIMVAGSDEHIIYVVITHGHDGMHAVRAMTTPIRVVCSNTQQLAIACAKSIYTIPHTSRVEDRIREARQALGLITEYADEFTRIAEQLAATEFELKQADKFFQEVVADRKNKEPRAFEEHWRGMKTTLESSPSIEGFRDRQWGALNAVTEWMDWKRPMRTDESRVIGSWEGAGRHYRNRALKLLTR